VGIQPGFVPSDDIARFELPDTVQDGGGGHVQLPGDVRVGDTRVALEQVENAEIGSVEHGLGLPSKSKIILPIMPVNNESSAKCCFYRTLFVSDRTIPRRHPSPSHHYYVPRLTSQVPLRLPPTSDFPLPASPWPGDFSHRLPLFPPPLLRHHGRAPRQHRLL